MDGDPSPRETETEKQLRVAQDEGEQHECLELMKGQKSEQLILECTTTGGSGPSRVLTQKSQGSLTTTQD